MRVEQLGEGTPEVAVVGAIHGDEPCGAKAIERILENPPGVKRSVKLIVANERALERGERYVDTDLNRAFPGDPESEYYEDRLAADLLNELEGCTVLALHSTQSTAEPFALVDAVDETARTIVPSLPVTKLVETGPYTEGRLVAFVPTIEVECGLQGSETAAENAYHVIVAFLRATDALDEVPNDRPDKWNEDRAVTVYRLTEPVGKPVETDEYEVLVDNFESVESGATFALANGKPVAAPDSFYPVLMSPYGYETMFGYKADRVGRLEAD